jgi:SMI1-KNR4 cell-wall
LTGSISKASGTTIRIPWRNYVEPPPSDELIASIEQELGGYRLPAAYVDLARRHNGGMVKRNCHPMKERTGWAEDHVAIDGLFAIGRTSKYSLAGQLGAKFMIEEWGYPPIGVGIADTPSGGHELIMLDYRACGKRGEPQVVYVDQEDDYSITVVAPDFETFICGLVEESEYDTPEEDRAAAIATVEQGTLSPIVVRALAAVDDRLPDGELVRRLDGDIKVPAKSTIHAVLDRHGLVKRSGGPRHRARGTPLSEGAARWAGTTNQGDAEKARHRCRAFFVLRTVGLRSPYHPCRPCPHRLEACRQHLRSSSELQPP